MLTKNDLARCVKHAMGNTTTLKQINAILDVTFEEIIRLTTEGEGFRIVNFATIEPSVRKSFMGTDPNNPDGPKIEVPEVRTLRFKPSAYWKETLNAEN